MSERERGYTTVRFIQALNQTEFNQRIIQVSIISLLLLFNHSVLFPVCLLTMFTPLNLVVFRARDVDLAS